jgi:hypothetical protein
MKKGQLCLSASNVELLMFLWKWKMATTQILWSKFFKERVLRTPYSRLTQLRRSGFIKVQPDREGRGAAWTLTRKGFDIVRDRMPRLRAEVFQTENFFHDVMVQSFHLGDWWNKLPEDVSLFTEQELRCHELDQFPDWVPRSSSHRPDGYWHFDGPNTQTTIALEIELSRKNLAEYGFVGDFYEIHSGVDKIIWVVDTRSVGEAIQRKIETHTLKKTKHNFLLLDQYLQQGWKAKFFSGPDQGISVQELFGRFVVIPPVVLPMPTRIDLRLFPEKSRSYRFVVSTSNAD